MIKSKVLGSRIIVKPDPAPEKTSGGVHIPDTAKERPIKGEIVSVGPGTKDDPMTAQIGDKILYGRYVGTEVTLEGGEYLIMLESDILVIL